MIAVAALSCLAGPLWAEDPRPAVRIVAVRTVDDGTEQARAQSPELTPVSMPYVRSQLLGPKVNETRTSLQTGTLPPPQIPGAPVAGSPAPGYTVPGYPVGTYSVGGAPVAGIATLGPAMPVGTSVAGAPVAAPVGAPVPGVPCPADGGLFPCPQMDAPLYAPGSPYTLPNPNTVTHKFWFSAEYLNWWTDGQNLPILASTGPVASNGILGAGGVGIFGGGSDSGYRSHGARFNAGYWFGCNQCWGLDFSYFFVSPNSQTTLLTSTQYPVLSRPFLAVNNNQQTVDQISAPGIASGSLLINREASLWGAEANVKKRWVGTNRFRLDALAGFRYLNFDESLTITETAQRIAAPAFYSGTIVDKFETTNDFYGGQIGLTGEWRCGRWYWQGAAKVAFGTTHQSVSIAGSQNLTSPTGVPAVANSGLFAINGANVGTFSQNKYAVLPEVGLNLGFHITPHWRVFVGYNFMYLSSVLRPGDQIDTTLDVARIPNLVPTPNATPVTPIRPSVSLKTSGVATHGISFGTGFSW
jgi:hypothetical protein